MHGSNRCGLFVAGCLLALTQACSDSDPAADSGAEAGVGGDAAMAAGRDASTPPDAVDSGAPFDDDGGSDEDGGAVPDASAPRLDGGPLDAGDLDAAMDAGPPRCELGVSDEITGLSFEYLVPGGKIPLLGSGQASLLIEVALRVFEPGTPDMDFVVTADVSEQQTTQEFPDEAGFLCGADGWCTLVPVFLPTQDLVDDPVDLMDLAVTIDVTLSEGGVPFCTATLEGPIHRQ